MTKLRRWGLLLLLVVMISGCASSGGSPLQQTQVALYVQQTVLAEHIAELTQEVDTVVVPPTAQIAALPTSAPEPLPAATSAPVSPPESTSSFESWRREATILLYEGIAGDPQRPRVISHALDGLGQNYFDAVSQIGEFQSQLSGSQTWDLIIYARENRDTQSGNPFGEIFAEYDKGSSVVIEYWNLDDVLNYSQPFTMKMERCGLTVTADWYDSSGGADMLLYAHNTQNPIHNQPNSNIRLTSFEYVRWTGDIGDFIRLKTGSHAQVLYGASETTNTTKATVVSCFDNRFVLQTFSTHQYDRDRMIMLWENYIYNTLYARYQHLGN